MTRQIIAGGTGMTKRFTYVKNNLITQYQSLPIQEIGKGKALHCQGIVDKLNKLYDENEQLKQEIRNLRDFRGFITEKNVENEQQRKELQLQMLRLYNYFEDYFEDGMGSTAFSEMWDNVKESEKWDKKKGMRK